MLNGPGDLERPRNVHQRSFLIRRMVETYNICGGSTRVASPLCTPASSMCSLMAEQDDLAMVGHRVDLDLSGVGLELRDDDRVFGRNRQCAVEDAARAHAGSCATLMAAPEST